MADNLLLDWQASFPAGTWPEADAIKEYIHTIETVITNTKPEAISFLNTLDPAANTIPFLYLLIRTLNHEGAPAIGKLKPHIVRFTQSFDPAQACWTGKWFVALYEQYYEHALASNKSAEAAPLLAQAILRLDPTSSTFTSLHLHCVEAAVLSRDITSGLQVISHDILHLPDRPGQSLIDVHHDPKSITHRLPFPSCKYISAANGFNPSPPYQQILQYQLLAGTLFSMNEDWQSAAHAFELCLHAPTTKAPSMIQVEAYKRLILANLLASGKLTKYPGHLPTPVVRSLRSLSQPYIAIADAYRDNTSTQQLISEMKAAYDILVKDNLLGLAYLVILAHQTLYVKRLSEIYASIPLAELIPEMPCRMDERSWTEEEVLSFLETLDPKLEIKASIIQSSTPYVTFTKTKIDEMENKRSLLKYTQRAADLDRHAQATRDKIELSREFQARKQQDDISMLHSAIEQSGIGAPSASSSTAPLNPNVFGGMRYGRFGGLDGADEEDSLLEEA